MRRNFSNKNKGFTLVEIILAIAILGIIGLVFLPILTDSFINIINAGNRSKGEFESRGELAEAIAKRESLTLDGKNLIFTESAIPIKFENKDPIYVDGGRIIVNDIATFIPNIPTLKFSPYLLEEGYLPSKNTIIVESKEIEFSLSNPISSYKINGQAYTPTRINNNKIKITLPTNSINAWKNEFNPYLFEVQTGDSSAKGLIQILQPKVMVVGNDSKVEISSDSNNAFAYWRDRDISIDKQVNINSVQYKNDINSKGYIAVGNEGKIISMYNNRGWKDINHGLTQENILDISYGDRMLVAVGENGAILQSDEKDIWSLNQVEGFALDLESSSYGIVDIKEVYVAVGESSSWLRKNNDDSWIKVNLSEILQIENEILEQETMKDVVSINYKEDGQTVLKFIAVGSNETIIINKIFSSVESELWFSNFNPQSNKSTLNSIAFNNNIENPIIVAVGEKSTVLFSDNTNGKIGEEWVEINMPNDELNFSDIEFIGGKFLAVANNNVDGKSYIISSEDGLNWENLNIIRDNSSFNGISGY